MRAILVAEGEKPRTALINERILNDDGLRIRFALSMLDHVVLELAGFCLATSLGDSWLKPVPVANAFKCGVVRALHETGQLPPQLSAASVLGLERQELESDPAMLAIRLSVRGIQATLAKPEFEDGFKNAERRSRYLQSDQRRREYARSVQRYDKYLSEPGNFDDWWQSGSPLEAIRKMLSR